MSYASANQKQLAILKHVLHTLENVLSELKQYEILNKESYVSAFSGSALAHEQKNRNIDTIADIHILESLLLERLIFCEEHFLPEKPPIQGNQLSLLKRSMLTLKYMQAILEQYRQMKTVEPQSQQIVATAVQPVQQPLAAPANAPKGPHMTEKDAVVLAAPSRTLRSRKLPLSFAQQRLWFLEQLDPGKSFYNEHVALRLTGNLHIDALELSFNEIMRRHEILRTTLHDDDGEMQQYISPWHPTKLAIIDLQDTAAEKREARMVQMAEAEIEQPFDFRNGPLFKIRLFQLADEDHLLLTIFHHTIGDGWSMAVLYHELSILYEAYCVGEASPLAELPIQYADYTLWQQQWLQSESIQQQLDYWQQQLQDAPAQLSFPVDRPRPLVQTYRGARQEVLLPLELLQQLHALSTSEQATLFMTLLTAFYILLMRYSGQRDILVGLPIANRSQRELEDLIGFFANTLILRGDLSGNPSFRQLLLRIREMSLQAYAHQDLPFEKLVAQLEPVRDMSRHPLFQVAFVLQSFPLSGLDIPGVSWHQLTLTKTTAKFDLLMELGEKKDGLLTTVEYSTDLFEATTIERLLDHWQVLLEAIVADADRSIEQLPVLTQTEEMQILRTGAGSDQSLRAEFCLHQLVEEQVRRTPDGIALTFEEKQLSYDELNRRANHLAHYLRTLKVAPDVPVGIYMERSPELVIALLAILKAGGAYVPLDPEYPRERLAYILHDAQIAIVLTQNELRARWSIDDGVTLVSLAPDHDEPALHDTSYPKEIVSANLPSATLPEHLAYVIYTSGSTGQPGGVQVSHANVVRLFAATHETFHFGAGDVWTLFHSFAFDFSVWEIWGALLHGGRLVVVPYWQSRSPQAFWTLLRQEGVTVLNQIPSAFYALLSQCMEQDVRESGALRTIIFGGEALDPRRLQAWFDRYGDQAPRLVNMYGITETTVHVTSHLLDRTDSEDGGSIIGNALADMQIYVLDKQRQPVPIGVTGELYVGGAGVVWGYRGRPELTAERFIPHPWSLKPGERLFRTGDLARWHANGRLEYIGRNDNQVKIRGYRIELGEIEAVLRQHPLVKDCLVVVREDVPGDRLVIAYVLLKNPADSVEAVKQHAQAYLPPYMRPALFVTLQELPLTPSGKIDRRSALPAPERQNSDAAYISPQTEVEQHIASIWRDVLPITQIGLKDNFFDLGGHSLSMLKVHKNIKRALKADLTLLDLFTYPTIEALARFLQPGEAVEQAHPVHEELSTVPLREQIRAHRSHDTTDIAIIGIAGRFPRAKDIHEFWHNLQQGVEAVSFFTDEELIDAGVDPDLFKRPQYVRAGAVLEDAALFDAAFFGYSPREAEIIDPQQRLFLECAWQALEDAGYDPDAYPGKIGVYAGASMNTYLISNLLHNRALVATMGLYQLLVGNGNDFLTTRTSYKLHLRGPSITLQTACSTSLVAVHVACESLRSGESDMALAGGVSVRAPQKAGYLYEDGGIHSPDGHCRAFDAASQGTVWGEGLGVVLLKRLDKAQADGDFIYAVIKGSAVNNDGGTKIGFTAPSVQGQAEVIAEALAMAGIAPETVSYIEAHGTGTPLGDPIEIAALRQIYGTDGSQKHCALGSVKTNIGHTDAAAGIAGLLKTILALQHQQLPPSLHFHTANPHLALSESPFSINTRLRSWASDGVPRRAGVSSFGMGGTNAHVLLEEAPPSNVAIPPPGSRSCQLIVLSARSESALRHARENLAQTLQRQPDRKLADVAYTLQVGRHAFNHRLALTCSDLAVAAQTLREPLFPGISSATQPETSPSPVFLFPGQGTQHVHMGAELYQKEPTFKRAIDQCAELLKPYLQRDLRALLYPADATHAATCAEQLDQTWLTQPALFATEYALAHLWLERGIQPVAMIGHSLGEYVAACLAGVFSLADALHLVTARGRLMQELPAGGMLMVALSETAARQYLETTGATTLSLAAHNGETTCVLAGPLPDIERLEQQMQASEIFCRRLHTSHAFHSQMMDPILQRFRTHVQAMTLRPPQRAYISNLTGTWMTAQQATDPDYWVEHLRQPIRFTEGLQNLLQDPTCLLLEVGPGQALSSLVRDHPARQSQQHVFSSLRPPYDQSSEHAFFLTTCGHLWCAGIEFDWAAFHTGEQRRRVPLPTYPFERKHYWITPDRKTRQDTPVSLSHVALTTGAESPKQEMASSFSHRPELSSSYRAPRSILEQQIAEIWQTLLGIEQIGIDDNFFELNGDSLLATRVMAHLRKALQSEIPLRMFFEQPTIAGLAQQIEQVQSDVQDQGKATPVAALRPQTLPLSFAQQRLWFLEQLESGNSAYNIPNAFRMSGKLSVSTLERSFQEMIRRHESLRTTFHILDDQPVQRIHTSSACSLPIIDLRNLPAPDREIQAMKLTHQHTRLVFDLHQGPLFRVVLVRLQQDIHVCLLTMHHIIADGWSMGILERELIQVYNAFQQGSKPLLPLLPMQYADFALWQRQFLQEEATQQHLAYWKGQLSGLSPLELPIDHPRPVVQTYKGARSTLLVPRALEKALQALAQQEDVTLFMTLLAAFQTLLYRYTGQVDIAIGTSIANRTRSELEGLVGCFVNTLVIRSHLAAEHSFLYLLQQVRDTTLQAYAHQDVPFEQVVEALQPERDLSHSPLFQVALVLQNTPRTHEQLAGLQLEFLDPLPGIAQFDLTLLIIETPGGLSCTAEYNTDLFDAGTITRLLGQWKRLLEGIVASPERSLAELPLLTEDERTQMLLAWNTTESRYVHERCVHELFAEQVEHAPDAIAVITEEQHLTYAALDGRANQLAWYLRRQGVGPEERVGVCLEQALDLIIALLAILKAGGVYVPLDPGYPQERLAFMLADSQPVLLLTHLSLRNRLPTSKCRIVCLDTDVQPTHAPPDNRASGGRPEHLAYMIYTSGSTGTPKGVPTTHSALLNLLLWMQQQDPLNCQDRMLQKTPFSFDVSIWELFWPLLTGAGLVIARPDERRDPAYLASLIAEQGVTTLHFVPSMLHTFLQEPVLKTRCASLRRVICGGEALSKDLQQRFFACLPARVQLYNFYGPTEAAIGVISWLCQRGDPSSLVPIGRPIAHTQMYLLNEAMQPAPVGVLAELYIGGIGLARGYHRRPELTAERFVCDPFSSQAGARLFKTGDLARYRADGAIEFLGRRDEQVKLRGYRIELGEIEAVLSQHPAVRQSMVILQETAAQGNYLVACVVPEAGEGSAGLSIAMLRSYLKERLPGYMLPSQIVLLDTLPLTPNGKVDRQALSALHQGEMQAQGQREERHPLSQMEALAQQVLQQVLQREYVGLQENFFEAGGHSLLATRVIAQLRQMLNIEVPLRHLFEAPTISDLAIRLEEEMRRGTGLLLPPIVPVARTHDMPLSYAQQRLWFLDQLEPGNTAYNISSALHLRGPLVRAALARALTGIMQRHENLRTIFFNKQGTPVQQIAPGPITRMVILDLSSLSSAIREQEMRQLVQQETRQPFDLAHGPLVRSWLLSLAEQDQVLVLSLHHIISDGWSSQILARELSTLYAALQRGERASLPALPVQYADYAFWQRQWLQGSALQALLRYWTKQLSGAVSLELPTDKPKLATVSNRGAVYTFALSPELSQDLQCLSRKEQVTLFVTLLTAFQILLFRYTKQQDIVVGTDSANRTHAETEDLIGFFVNLLALRTQLHTRETFQEVLKRVSSLVLNAYAHQDLPFEKIVEALQLERASAQTPLVNVLFVMQDDLLPALALQDVTIDALDIEQNTAKFDLAVFMVKNQQELTGVVNYRTDLFDLSTISTMMNRFQTLLQSVVAVPEAALKDLEIYSQEERAQQLSKANSWRATDQRKLKVARREALKPSNAGISNDSK